MGLCSQCADKSCMGYDSRISECEDFKPITNADRIRAMTDEELANAIVESYGVGAICPLNHTHIFCVLDNGCKSCWLEWLRKEADE